jgi:hypothetical protein
MPTNHSMSHTDEAKTKMRAARLGKPAPWKQRARQEIDGEIRYRCGGCGDFLPKEAFYGDKRNSLGIKSECKACHTATSIASRNRDRARETNAAYMARARAKNPAKFRELERLAARKRPFDEKVRARQHLNDAVRTGKVSRPTTCQQCGQSRRVHGHHDDYSKPLQVRWLCSACHGREHRVAP